MSHRRRVVGLSVVLLAACRPVCPQTAAWQVRVEDDATATILHAGSPVASWQHVFWGPAFKWAGARLSAPAAADGRRTITGAVADLGLTFDGAIEREPGGLRFDYRWTAAAAKPGIIGGGLEFRLRLGAPSLGGQATDPVLLPGNGGWEWPVAPGQKVAVRFEPAAAQVFFERGNKGQIRGYLVSENLAAGPGRLTMHVALPTGGEVVRGPAERYGPTDPATWPAGLLAHDQAPLDLSWLNEKPAGGHGFVAAQGDQLVFADGTPVRFWGGNLAAYALFVDQPQIEVQAKRIAQLGYNLMRLHHHDSTRWVSPTVIDKAKPDSRSFDAAALDRLDYWIHCLKREGVYVWLDLHVGRVLKEGDVTNPFGTILGWDEIVKRGAEVKGFCYYNDNLRALMQEFNAQYVSRTNPYTGLAYKDEPAIMGMLITNENDLTHHFGNLMLGDKGNPYHNGLFEADVKAFAQRTGLPAAEVGRTWVAGPSKIYLNDRERGFHAAMIEHLRKLGVKVPLATTNTWGNCGIYSLPALADGDLIDVHSYGNAEALSNNPRFDANYVHWIAAGQVADKPVTITEWNVPHPTADRFTAPLYVAAVASLQGWDAPMIYNYSQERFDRPTRPSEWSSYPDPALQATMPAVALLYRQGHVQPAKRHFVLQLDRTQAVLTDLSAASCPAVRTLAEQSRVSLGLPDLPELDWDRATPVPVGATVVTDPAQDFLPPGNTVTSDTGELSRDWVAGVQTVNTPRTQAASGWIGGRRIDLGDLSVAVTTPQATVIVTALDGQPIASSKRVLVTTVARAIAVGGRMPFRSEPVVGELRLRAPAGLTVTALKPDGTPAATVAARYEGGRYQVPLTADAFSHWYLLQ